MKEFIKVLKESLPFLLEKIEEIKTRVDKL